MISLMEIVFGSIIFALVYRLLSNIIQESTGVSKVVKAALDNRSNQLNPNNWRFAGRK